MKNDEVLTSYYFIIFSLIIALLGLVYLGGIILNDAVNLGPTTKSIPGNIDACQDLNTPGEYILVKDINNVEGDCFLIFSDNILLDGNGHNIIGDGTGIGVGVDQKNNVSIKSLQVLNFKESFSFNSISYTNITNISSDDVPAINNDIKPNDQAKSSFFSGIINFLIVGFCVAIFLVGIIILFVTYIKPAIQRRKELKTIKHALVIPEEMKINNKQEVKENKEEFSAKRADTSNYFKVIQLIDEIDDYLKKNQINKAMAVYEKLQEIFNSMTKFERKELFRKIEEIYEKINSAVNKNN
jgi:hypothetical protein